MSFDRDALIRKAIEVRNSAYSKYSGFSVGAALIDENGRVHAGCNVENASYPLGSCAETGAIAAMITAGAGRIVAIAVAGGGAVLSACTPCGGCRQRINEFADEDTVIIVRADDGEWADYSISELLPDSFRLP